MTPLRGLSARFRDLWRDAPLRPSEFAAAPLLGVLVHAGINLVATWVALGVPSRWGLRFAHHAFDLVESLAVAGWVAGILAALAWLDARHRAARDRSARPASGLRFRVWLAYGLLAAASMEWVLGDHLRRQSDALLEGRFAWPLRIVMLIGCGIGVVAAHALGSVASRLSARASATVALAGLVALAGNHVVMRDDYANLHTAVAWIAATGFGAVLARRAVERLRTRERGVTRMVALATLVGSVAPPPNAVRLELFRESGAVASWVLARCVWRLPPNGHDSSAGRPIGPAESPPRARLVPAPVVVLITVDALRADVVVDPANDARFPYFARLKRSGLYVPRAVSSGSQTSVTLSALFSGRTFSEQRWTLHGVGSARFHYPATDPAPRLPERLAEAGIRSEGFFALRFLAGEFGVTRGFSVEHMRTSGRRHATAAEVLNPLFAALLRARPDQPAFYFAHLTEPHEPYDRGKIREGSAWERYLSEVEVVDAWLGRLMRRLEQHAPGRAYLLVSADHGEAFGEHGTEFHTKTLYDELLRVPVLMTGPGIPPSRSEALASIVDLRPTVLDLFGVASEPGTLGASLLPRALGEADDTRARPPVVAEGRLRRAYYTADGLKVIEDHVHKTIEVFDLVRDPGELENLFERDPRATRALADLRAAFEARRIEGVEPPYKP